jgi:ABC-type sugar transport system ATPase subunit
LENNIYLDINIEKLEYFYGSQALSNINFSCNYPQGKIAVVGKEDAGKTTLVRAIVGLEKINKGVVKYADEEINNPIKSGLFQVLFTENNFFRYKSVYSNLAYILSLQKIDKKNIKAKVFSVLIEMDILHLKDTKIYKLSQLDVIKVQLSKLLLRDTKFVLVDNIFSGLSITQRKEAFCLFKNLVDKSINRSFIYTTDLPEEALSFGGGVIVLRYGSLEQQGSWNDFLHNPVNLYVDKLFNPNRTFRLKKEIPYPLQTFFDIDSINDYIVSYSIKECVDNKGLIAKIIDYSYLDGIFLVNTDLGKIFSQTIKKEYCIEISEEARYYSIESEKRLTIS